MGKEVAKNGTKVVELDHISDKYLLYREKRSRLETLKDEVEKLRAELENEIGDAEEARIMDEPVITYGFIDKLKTSELKKDNPDLFEEYVRAVVKKEFDPVTFKKDHPNLFKRYQSRQFKVVDK
jgi:hypothetical protein